MKPIFATNNKIDRTFTTKDNLTELIDVVTSTPSEAPQPTNTSPVAETPAQVTPQSPSDTNQTVQGNDGEPVTLNIRMLG